MTIEKEKKLPYLDLQKSEVFGQQFEILVGTQYSFVGFGNIDCATEISECQIEFENSRIHYSQSDYQNRSILCVNGDLDQFEWCKIKGISLSIVVSLLNQKDHEAIAKKKFLDAFRLNLKLKNKIVTNGDFNINT